MTNEIKEILDYMKEESNYKHLSFNASKLLLNYITNLQEENERLALELSGYRTAILKDDKLLGLQEKINKAIEYINKNSYLIQDKEINGIPLLSQRLDKCTDLLEILKGKDNE